MGEVISNSTICNSSSREKEKEVQFYQKEKKSKHCYFSGARTKTEGKTQKPQIMQKASADRKESKQEHNHGNYIVIKTMPRSASPISTLITRGGTLHNKSSFHCFL